MAFPTAVNNQITDAVTQSNISVMASAPSVAMGSLYQSMAHSLGLAYENSVASQQQLATISQAVTTNCVALLLDADKKTKQKQS